MCSNGRGGVAVEIGRGVVGDFAVFVWGRSGIASISVTVEKVM